MCQTISNDAFKTLYFAHCALLFAPFGACRQAAP